MFQSFTLLDVTWANLKTFKTRDGFGLYYVQQNGGHYEVIGISNKSIYRSCLAASTDITDFVDNYRSAAELAASLDDAIGTANTFDPIQILESSGNTIATDQATENFRVQQASAPSIGSEETGWIGGTLTTSSSTPDQTILTYTVPTGKTFYVMYHEVIKATVNSVSAIPVKLLVDNTEKARIAMPGGNLNTVIYPTSLYAAYPLATSGQVIKITVTPNGTPSTTWSARLLGAIK